MSERKSLGEDFPRQIERCKELAQAYRDIGSAGRFGLALIEDAIRRAEAVASDDIVAMVRLYAEMRGFK